MTIDAIKILQELEQNVTDSRHIDQLVIQCKLCNCYHILAAKDDSIAFIKHFNEHE